MKSIFQKIGSFVVLSFALFSAYAADEAVFFQPSGAGQQLTPSNTVIVSAPLQITLSRLDGVSEAPVVIDLQPFTVAAPDAQLVLHGEGGTQTSPLEVRQYFRGTIQNYPNSFAFVGLDSTQSAKAIIHADSTVVVAEMGSPNTTGKRTLTARPVNAQTDFADRTFQCGVDNSFLSNFLKNSTEAGSLNEIVNLAIRAGTHLKANLKADAPSPLRRANLIIETDFELFQALGSNTSTYVQDLMAYVSSIYQTEASTRFQIGQINVYTTSVDPWSANSGTLSMLNELRSYWNDPARFAANRHHVHLISGKSAGGGVAWLNTLADKSYAYGVSANINGTFVSSNPQVVWDAVVVAHEIGHAFGSDHTHNYDAPYLGSPIGGAVDCCAVGSSDTATQCRASGLIGQLPGVGSRSGGTPGAGNGTIMSYCHLLSPNMSNIAMTFGVNHTFGANAFRVSDVLRTSAATLLPLDTTDFTLTVAKSGTGTGTVTSNPAGISCGSDCSEAYATGSSVTLTASSTVGSYFSAWSGDCSGTSPSCTVTMSAAKNVNAIFTAGSPVEPLRVTGLTGAAGSSQYFSINVPSGATNLVIQLSGGTPDAGLYVKAGQAVTVGNADCTSSQPNTNDETCTFTQPAATTYNILVFGWGNYSGANLTAAYMYAGAMQTLTVNKSGLGSGTVTSSPAGINCGLDCKEPFATSTSITLTATPATGSKLKNWSGCNASTDNSCTVTNINAATSITATFDKSGGITPILMLLLD